MQLTSQVKKKEDDDDNDWAPIPSNPAKIDSVGDQSCIIHCTNSKEKLSNPQSIECAVARELQAVLDIYPSLFMRVKYQ